MVTIKKGDIIDYTKYRKGSKPFLHVIDICPKCNRKGEKKVHKTDITFIHKSQVKDSWLFPIDYCFIPKKQIKTQSI